MYSPGDGCARSVERVSKQHSRGSEQDSPPPCERDTPSRRRGSACCSAHALSERARCAVSALQVRLLQMLVILLVEVPRPTRSC